MASTSYFRVMPRAGNNPHYHMLYVYYRNFLRIRSVLKLPTLYNAKYFRLDSTVKPIIGI
jgi:hypothetical protein